MTNCMLPLIGPYIAGLILQSNLSDSLIGKWNLLFVTSSITSTAGALLFLMFGDATRQQWDRECDMECDCDQNDNEDNCDENSEQNVVIM